VGQKEFYSLVLQWLAGKAFSLTAGGRVQQTALKAEGQRKAGYRLSHQHLYVVRETFFNSFINK